MTLVNVFQNTILIFKVDFFVIIVDDGKKLEKELNDKGPGEAYYIKCDVTIEEDIKVIKHLTSRRAWEFVP